ncbi:MAG: 50S ribosomal protein L10 [Betaproteobacteria bacterium]|nr:50S ribosomal protein L10 [Betaproteobacteria bacterium]
MGLNRSEKAVVVDKVSAQVAQSQAIILAEYRGLSVGALTELRRQARAEGVYLRVLKNTTSFEGLAKKMVGPLMYGMSSDPVSAAKVLSAFAKGNDKLVLKAGAMPNYVMDENGVKALANMPSREALLATLLGTLQAPVAKLARTLNEVPGKFVRTLAALEEKRKEPV